MTIDRTLAIAHRISIQMLHDRRSLALIIVAPLVVMALVGLTFADQRDVLNRVAPALITTFTLFFTFVLTGVSFLRERSQGTLERLTTTTVSRGDILAGYLLGFLLFALLQLVAILFFTIVVLQVTYQGAIWEAFVILLLLTVVSVNLGIFVSTFARNEFQVVQFIPLVFAPQLFLAGILVPLNQMPRYLEIIAHGLPLTYAVEALQDLMIRGNSLGDELVQLGVLAAFAVGFFVLASLTVKRT